LHAFTLAPLGLRVDPQHVRRRPFFGLIRVDADDDVLGGVDALLGAIGGVLDFTLDDAGFDRPKRAAQPVDAFEQRPRAAFDFVSHRFDRERTADRIDRVRHAALVRDDLLRAQRNLR
jgi:hypothetical protein